MLGDRLRFLLFGFMVPYLAAASSLAISSGGSFLFLRALSSAVSPRLVLARASAPAASRTSIVSGVTRLLLQALNSAVSPFLSAALTLTPA